MQYWKILHFSTYLFLTTASIIFDVAQVIQQWQTNEVLFFASVMTTAVTLVAGMDQITDPEHFQYKWMLWYTIPMALGVFGQAAGFHEAQNNMLVSHGLHPSASPIPGTSCDYQEALHGHYLSMAFPFFAYWVAKGMQYLIETFNPEERP